MISFLYEQTTEHRLFQADDMSPVHFSHHGSLLVKADFFLIIPEKLQRKWHKARLKLQSHAHGYTTVVVCALWTPAMGVYR